MKSVKADLLSNIVTTYGDTSKTFRTSLISLKTIPSTGKVALGPGLNQFLSTVDDFGVAPVSAFLGQNRVFVIGAVTAGLARVMLYDVDPTTGVATPVGSLNMQFINAPATTHTIRAFVVDDGGSSATVTGWKIFVATTGSVTANGGLYMAGCAAAGIAKTDFTSTPATIPTATLADSKQVYKLENSPFTLTAAAAIALHRSSTNVYMLNGVSATYQAYKVDYSLATGVPGANGVITSLNSFGGTGITGNLPALTGTLLLTNSGKFAIPTESYIPVALQNNPCFFFATTTRTYLGLLSELTAGGTTWPSLNEANNVIPFSPGVYINPTYTYANWSDTIQRENMGVAQSIQVVKTHQNNMFERFYGQPHDRFLESGGYGGFRDQVFGGLTVTQMDSGFGWAGLVSTSVSQRGVVLSPISADQQYGLHYIITKVMDTVDAVSYQFAGLIQQLRDISVGAKLQYRTSGFASETSGWTDVPMSFDMSSLVTGDQIQFRILFRILTENNFQAQQVEELFLSFISKNETSDKYQYIKTFSSESSPAKWAWRQKTLYGGTPPTQYVNLYDTSAVPVLFGQFNSVTHSSQFTHSTDGGSSFSAGVGPDLVGKILVFTLTSPPGIALVGSIREQSV